MTMTKDNEMVGCTVEYISRGLIYTGVIIDKVLVLERDGESNSPYNLYLVKQESGLVFKISPTQIKRILHNE